MKAWLQYLKRKFISRSETQTPSFNFSRTWASTVLKLLEYLWLTLGWPNISSSPLSPSVSSGSNPEHSLVALVQKISPSFLLLLGKATCLCHPAAKSSPTVKHFIGWKKHIPLQNLAARITRLLLPKMLQRPSAFYPQAMDNLLTAISIHEICPHCFTVAPTLHLKTITGGPNTKTDCPFAILSLLAGKWKMLSFVWICVSASQEMKLWSLPDGEWLWLFISLG